MYMQFPLNLSRWIPRLRDTWLQVRGKLIKLESWEMKFGKLIPFVCLCVGALPALAGVTVNSPTNGASVGSSVHFVASASSPACSKGVSAIGIYSAPGVLAYVKNGTSLDTYVSMPGGTQYPVVQ